MTEGFCTRAQADEPLDAYGRCLPHNESALGPSWGHSLQRWRSGTWVPFVPKPDGYVYTPKVYAAPVPKPPRVVDRITAPTVSRERTRRSRPKAPPRPKPPVFARPCARCQTPYFPKTPTNGGSPSKFCGDACRSAAYRARERQIRAVPMSAQGRVCAECKRDDAPHKGDGLCRRCWNRAYRRTGASPKMPPQPCTGCQHPERPLKANGLCELCYRADRRGKGLDRQDGRTRQTMADRGIVCRVCGHDGEREYRAGDVCWNCWMRQYRAQRKAGAA